jgi:hypothetical protein
MGEFKLVVVLSIMVSLIALGAIIYISENAVGTAKILDVTRGQVKSKDPLANNSLANYVVNLSDNRVLYISSNMSLYNSIQENQSYVFDCFIDFPHRVTFIDKVSNLSLSSPAP